MQIIFKNTRTNEQLIMPVTPPEFLVSRGREIEQLDMASVGQVNLPGIAALLEEQQEFLLPAEARNYTQAGYAGSPYTIVDQLCRWSENGDVLRLIVTETPVNEPVLLGPVRYGERDGTGDVYVTLEIRGYRYLTDEITELPETGNTARTVSTAETAERTYVVEAGDCLWLIARRFYGDGSLAQRLAVYNGIKNANLIYPGELLRIPDKSML